MKASFHIKPDIEHNAVNSVLLLIAGTRHCSFAVMNHLSKELIEFGYFTAQDENDYLQFFEETGLMNNRYYQTAIAYDATESVQVPAAVYKYDEGPLYLDAIYGNAIRTNTVSENLPVLNLYNVYRMPSILHTSIGRRFLNARSWHLYTVILKNIASRDTDSMFINFKTDEFSLIAVRQGKVALCQTFSYNTPEDVLYYLLKSCQQLDFSQQTVKIFLSGLIEKDSAVYRELYKYFINAGFESLAGDIKLSHALSIHPAHYYSSISKLAACVS